MHVSPTRVTEAADYTFEINLSQSIPAGGSFKLKFSTGVDLTLSQDPVTAQIPCTATYGFGNAPGAECTVLSASEIEFKGAFPSSDFLLIFTLEDVINPSFVSTFFVQPTSFDAFGNLLETSGSTAFKFLGTPGELDTKITNLGSDVVGEHTNIQIDITVNNFLTDEDYFVFETAKWNQGTQTVGLEQPQFKYSAADFDLGGSGFLIPCSSPTSTSIKCTFYEVTATTPASIATTYDRLVIQNIGALAIGDTLQVQIENSRFRNPPSTAQVKTYRCYSFNSNNALKAAQESDIKYQVSTPAVLPSESVLITSASGEINDEDQFDFTIQMPLPLPVGAVITLKIPSSINIFSDEAKTKLILNAVSGYSPIYVAPQVQVLDATSQEIKITNLVPSTSFYVDSDNFVKFSLLDMKNPDSIKQTDVFEMSIYDQDNLILTVDNTNLRYTAKPGSLKQIRIEPENYKTREAVSYSIRFVTKNTIPADGKLTIKIPAQIKVDQAALTAKTRTLVKEGATFSYDESTKTIQFDSPWDKTYTDPQLVEIDFPKGLVNPLSTDPVDPFVISTLDSSGEVIDQGESAKIEFTPNEIQAIQTKACAEKQTASMTEDICTYRLKFLVGANFPIMAGSRIEIELPEDLEFGDPELTESESYTEGIADLSSAFRVVGKNNQIEVSGAFVQSSAPNGVDWRQDSFSVFIAGIKSPRSTAPTLSFKAKILDAMGYPQYQKQSGVYSNVYQARTFKKAIIQRDNEVNGEDTGSYIFTLELSSEVFKNEYVKITPPDAITITPGGDQCQGLKLLSDKLACTMKEKSLYVHLVPDDPSMKVFETGSIIQFAVKQITNPLSLEPSESFMVYITTSLLNDYFVNQMKQGLSVLNTEEGDLTNVQVLPDDQALGKTTNYKVLFTTSNELPKGSYVEIEFPRKHFSDLDKITCEHLKTAGFRTRCYLDDERDNVLIIDRCFDQYTLEAGLEIGFLLKNVRNPLQSLSEDLIRKEFKITTLTSDEYPIDTAKDMDFSIGCLYPCLSCDGEANICSSCQMLNPFQSLYLFEQTCVVNCPPGYFPNQSNQCVRCAYPCERCESATSGCLSCLKASGLPYVYDETGQCFDNCPAGTFKSEQSLSCEDCVNNCSTCNSENECLSCSSEHYFFEGQCLDTCPEISILFQSDKVQECQRCKSPCYTCEESIDQCTSCLQGYYLHENECLEECPSTYLANEENVCYLAAETTLPFITLIVPVTFLVLIMLSKFKYTSSTRIYSAFLALQSSFIVLFWFYFLIFLLKDGHKASSVLLVFALFSNYLLNWIWYDFYQSRILKNDDIYCVYKEKYSKTQNRILIACLLTSFQLFRFQYSCLFDKPQFKASMKLRSKYHKRMNRYTLFQITFVYLPTICASCYNLFYTWSGRQIFWIDIENLVVISLMMIFHTIVIFKTQKEYLIKIIDLGEPKIEQPPEQAVKGKYKIWADQDAQDLVNDINKKGFDKELHRERIQALSRDQRVGALKTLVNSFFQSRGGKKPQNDEKDPDFMLKHGRGGKMQIEDVDVRKAYQSEIISKKKKGLGDLLPVKSEKEGYKKFDEGDNTQIVENTLGLTQTIDVDETINQNSVDMDATGVQATYEQVVQDTSAVTITAAQALDGDQDTHPKEPESGSESKQAMDGTLRLKEKQPFDGIVEDGPKDDSSDEEFDKELLNFASAPLNAQSALRGNAQLEKRLGKLQDDLKKQIEENKNKRKITIDDFAEMSLEQKKKLRQSLSNVHQSNTSPRKSNLLSPETKASLKKRGTIVVERMSEFWAGITASMKKKRPSSGNKEEKQEMEFSKEQVEKSESVVDSDSLVQDYTSSQWGEGTSKVVVAHYNTTQARRKKKFEETAKEWKNTEKSTIPEKIIHKKLTTGDFEDISDELAQIRAAKKLAKDSGEIYQRQAKELEAQVKVEVDENERLRGLIRDLETKISAEMVVLKEAQDKKEKDVQFVENAFYTSNEDGMGVSPNTYELQNRYHKPGSKPKSPEKKQVNVVVEEVSMHQSVHQSMHQTNKTKMSERQSSRGNIAKSKKSSRASPLSKSRKDGPISADEEAWIAQSERQGHSARSKKSRSRSRGQRLNSDDHNRTSRAGSRQSPRKKDSKYTTQGTLSISPRRNRLNMTGKLTESESLSKKSLKRAGSEIGNRTSKNRRGKDLQHLPLHNEQEELEYYTSEDEQGRKVQKMRKAKRGKKSLTRQQTELKSKGKKKLRSRTQNVSKFGSQAKTLQDIRKLQSFDKFDMQDQDALNRSGADRRGKSTNAVDQLGQNSARARLKFSPTREEDQFEYYTSEDDEGHVIQKMRRKQYAAGAFSHGKWGQNNRSRVANKPPVHHFNNQTITSFGDIRGTSPMNVTGGFSQSSSKLSDRGEFLRQSGIQQLEQNSLQDLSLLDKMQTTTGKRKHSKPKRPPPRNYGGAYFKHTNFERAVIASNGRYPYNNKEVEVISKREGFDPNQFSFKNNWVQKMMHSANKHEGGAVGGVSEAALTQQRYPNVPSASVTATTVFQGMNPHQSATGSFQKSSLEPVKQEGHEGNSRPYTGMTQQQMANASPVALRDSNQHSLAISGAAPELSPFAKQGPAPKLPGGDQGVMIGTTETLPDPGTGSETNGDRVLTVVREQNQNDVPHTTQEVDMPGGDARYFGHATTDSLEDKK